MEIFQNLKQARVRRSLTQEQAAEQLHTTRQTISSYETGRTQPDLDAAFSLWSLFLLVVLLVMLFQDLSLRDPGPLRRRTVLFLLLTAGSFAATIPWGLFDPLFHTGNYRIAAYAGICYSLLVLLIDLSVLVWRKRRRRAA